MLFCVIVLKNHTPSLRCKYQGTFKLPKVTHPSRLRSGTVHSIRMSFSLCVYCIDKSLEQLCTLDPRCKAKKKFTCIHQLIFIFSLSLKPTQCFLRLELFITHLIAFIQSLIEDQHMFFQSSGLHYPLPYSTLSPSLTTNNCLLRLLFCIVIRTKILLS